MARRLAIPVTLTATVLLLALSAGASLGGATPSLTGAKHVMPTIPQAQQLALSASPSVDNLINHGGPVQTSPKVYIVFWGWTSGDPSGEAPYLVNFFNGIGGTSWANIQTQYSSITNPTGQLKGVWWDNATVTQGGYPVVPDLYIGNEALRAEAHFGFDANADYFIATPHLHNDAGFGAQYCAWHSSETDGSNRVIAYTDFPYIPDAQAGTCGQNFVNSGSAGLLDGVSMVGGHEYAEAVTDPHLDAWYDSAGNENGDKCAWNSGPGAVAQDITLSTGTFAVQSLWSNAASGCAIHYP